MARAIWKGDISFGLVSIPISLVSAVVDFVSLLKESMKKNQPSTKKRKS